MCHDKFGFFLLFFRLTLLTRYKSNRLTDFYEILHNVCLLHVMIPIVFGFVQMRAERVGFSKPIKVDYYITSKPSKPLVFCHKFEKKS